MREILVVTSRTSVRPYRLSGWKWGDRTASGTGEFGQFSLAGNPMAALRFGTRVFLAGNHFLVTSNGIKSTKKRRRNLRSLTEEILERGRGRRRRKNFNENQRKTERNRARDKTLFTTVSFQVSLKGLGHAILGNFV